VDLFGFFVLTFTLFVGRLLLGQSEIIRDTVENTQQELAELFSRKTVIVSHVYIPLMNIVAIEMPVTQPMIEWAEVAGSSPNVFPCCAFLCSLRHSASVFLVQAETFNNLRPF
jgi:hypothetical protein